MYLGLLNEKAYLPADYWTALVPGTERVEIEIGPGDCGFLTTAARRDPHTLFVGFEIRASAVERVLSARALPENFKLYHGDGRWLVAHLLAPASIDVFHVYFPDPWWKKRHRKRRLFTPEFCAGLTRCLKTDGLIRLVTDVAPLFEEIREMLEARGFTVESRQASGEAPGYSAYETKYRRQGRSLHEAVIVRAAG